MSVCVWSVVFSVAGACLCTITSRSHGVTGVDAVNVTVTPLAASITPPSTRCRLSVNSEEVVSVSTAPTIQPEISARHAHWVISGRQDAACMHLTCVKCVTAAVKDRSRPTVNRLVHQSVNQSICQSFRQCRPPTMMSAVYIIPIVLCSQTQCTNAINQSM